jgi:uncharacterized membrane protein
MTAIFELLFKYRPLLYEKGVISFRPLWHPYLIWVLVIAALFGAYWFYRKASNVLNITWRSSLTSLRAASFLLIILLFSQPVLLLHSVTPQENFVAIAYDLSKSMEIRDGANGQSRLDMEQQLLKSTDNPFIKELAAKFKLRFFRFSKGAERSEACDIANRHGGSTDLERSLNQVMGEMAAAPLAGIVLVTDGADNGSTNLDKTAAQLRAHNIPVNTVGIGTPKFPRDAEVLRVAVPRKVLKDTAVEAEVSVVATGYSGQRSRLQVLEGDKPVQSQDITLGSDGEVKTIKLNFSSQSAGPRIYKFSLTPLAGEIVSENNEETALIEVLDEKPQVLYIEGEPRWEYAFIRRAVTEDKNLRLDAILRKANAVIGRQVESGAALEKGFPVEKPELFRYKTIIMGSVEASFFTFDQLRMISDFVSQRGGGFIMLGGKSSFGQGGYANTPIEDLLPVSLGEPGSGGFEEVEYRARLTSYGLVHPVTHLAPSEDQNRKKWDAAPTLAGFNQVSKPKPGATVLAQGSVLDSRGQSPVILAFQRFGRGKSVALTASNTWRWRMGLNHADNMHQVFWKQMLRWLVSDAPDVVNTTTDRNSYSREDSVVIRAEANDSSFLPVNNAQVTAQVKAPSGQTSSVQLLWDVEKDGAYSANFEPQEEGVYVITCEAYQGNKSLGAGSASFRVSESNEEFHNANMNLDLLKRLSSETGGRYYSPNDVRTLPEDISYTDKGLSRLEEKDLWDMPFLFLLLVGLISTEWILRKRKGLA